MSAYDNPRVLGRPRLSFANEAEVDTFVATLERFERGELDAEEWRKYRLVHGVYDQRQDGVSMVRVKIPQGILSGPQLRAVAETARRFSRGFGHITTRQNVQLHFVKPSDYDAALHGLAQAGLTTREACGNSVRNISACPFAGVSADEPFDLTPYADALTRHLLRHELSAILPRKFKIAWEGCSDDHAGLAIHDIGFQARVRGSNGSSERGFRVTAGGGTSTLCRSGWLLDEFLPAADILVLAEAVLHVYQRLGDYKHRQRNRMKFLIGALGFERWRDEVHAELARLKDSGPAQLPFDANQAPEEAAPGWERPAPPTPAQIDELMRTDELRGPGITPQVSVARDWARWSRTNLRPQRQAGFSTATITVPLGDLTAAQMEIIAALCEAHGDSAVRATSEQNLVLRWVPDAEAPRLYELLAAAGLGLPDAGSLADVVSCPGAESCRLAVTHSRGLGRMLGDYLRARPDLVDAAPDASIKISGCPNGCSRHHIATIGFQGSIRKLNDKAVPQYFVLVGGGIRSGSADFGRIVAKVPARRMQQVVARLIEHYQREKTPGETTTAFFARLTREQAHALLADLEQLDTIEAADFVDLGEAAELTAGQ